LTDYRSLWMGGQESGLELWKIKLKLANKALDLLETMLRLAAMRYAPHLGGAPTTQEVEMWLSELRGVVLEQEVKNDFQLAGKAKEG
jgi:hypothetical protein